MLECVSDSCSEWDVVSYLDSLRAAFAVPEVVVRLGVFSVLDSKAAVFGTPWFARTRGVAVRMFVAAVNQPDHDWHRFAEDYSLHQVGEWDEVLGALVPCAPEPLLTGVAALAISKRGEA